MEKKTNIFCAKKKRSYLENGSVCYKYIQKEKSYNKKKKKQMCILNKTYVV